MAINTGVNASKVVAFAVAVIPQGVDVTKAVAFTVLTSPDATAPSWPSFSFVDGARGTVYSQSFRPNGTQSITVTVSAGSLPAGLTLSPVSGGTYKISGTPTASGTFTFTLLASSAYGSVGHSFSITINPDPPSWPAFSFTDGVVGIGYSQSFTPGGSPTVTLQAGSLPTGLSLSLVTGSTYQISGTPTTPGAFTFTLRASNVDGDADQVFTITINAASIGGSYCFIA